MEEIYKPETEDAKMESTTLKSFFSSPLKGGGI